MIFSIHSFDGPSVNRSQDSTEVQGGVAVGVLPRRRLEWHRQRARTRGPGAIRQQPLVLLGFVVSSPHRVYSGPNKASVTDNPAQKGEKAVNLRCERVQKKQAGQSQQKCALCIYWFNRDLPVVQG